MKKLALAGSFLLIQATTAMAMFGSGSTTGGTGSGAKTAQDVPEISALEGTAALAALAAIVLLAWERRRRAA